MRIIEFQTQRIALFIYLVTLSYEDICFYEVMLDSEDGHSKFSPENFPYFRFYYGLTNLGLLGVHKDSKKEVDSLNLPGVSLTFLSRSYLSSASFSLFATLTRSSKLLI